MSVYEVPFIVDPDHEYPTPDYEARLDELVAADDRGGAAKHFMRNAIGLPAPFVLAMRLMPIWKGLKATANTLPYDWEALDGRNTMYGAPLSVEEFAAVDMPAQVVAGDKSDKVLRQSSKALARVLPDSEHTRARRREPQRQGRRADPRDRSLLHRRAGPGEPRGGHARNAVRHCEPPRRRRSRHMAPATGP